MIQKEDQYFRINRILLLTIGLWPYQQSIFTTFQFIFLSVILTAFIIFQMTTFLTLNCTSELLMNILPSASFFTIFIIKYYIFRFNIESVKNLLMQLQHIHNELKDKNEIAIIKKYDCSAKRFTLIFTTFGICAISIVTILLFWINMTNVDLPMNASRSHNFIITMEYFIDQEKYFYLIALHFFAAICIGSAVMVASGTMFIAYIQHICGIFRIASYRIERAINVNIRQNITLKNKISITESIICAIDIHLQAMKLNKLFMSVLETLMFCLLVCFVVCLSLNLFQITSENNIEKFLVPLIRALVCILYMFLANLMGQTITDHNNNVFLTAYNVQWYNTPLHIQRIMLFLLQKGTQKFTLNVGGLFDASMECFAMLMKASVSYFTVMYSTR